MESEPDRQRWKGRRRKRSHPNPSAPELRVNYFSFVFYGDASVWTEAPPTGARGPRGEWRQKLGFAVVKVETQMRLKCIPDDRRARRLSDAWIIFHTPADGGRRDFCPAESQMSSVSLAQTLTAVAPHQQTQPSHLVAWKRHGALASGASELLLFGRSSRINASENGPKRLFAPQVSQLKEKTSRINKRRIRHASSDMSAREQRDTAAQATWFFLFI